MTNNQENNDNDNYVMADEPLAPPISRSRFPWWLILLPLILVSGAGISFLLNNNKTQLADKESTVPLPNGKNGTGGSETVSLPNGKNVTGGSGTASLPNGKNGTKPKTESIEVTEIVHFGYKETEVLAADTPKLASFWFQLQDTTGTLTIEGHADNIGSDKYNYNLAKKRAEQVASKLRELGLDEQYQVKIQSWGETKPTGDNNTEEGRALNRRVALSFSNKSNSQSGI